MLKGYYRDILIDDQRKVIWEHQWRANAIVRSCDHLLAALLKSQEGIAGIQYWAVGEGRPAWDGNPPAPDITTTRLSREMARQVPRVTYVGNTLNALEVQVEFKGEDLVANGGAQSLREFGLFGGNAAEAADSGYLIDYAIHPRIDLAPGNTLIRRLQLTFATSKAPGPGLRIHHQPSALGAAIPVAHIDGIGTRFAEILHAQGIQTLNDLADLDYRTAHPAIPTRKFKEFHTKANLVLRRRKAMDAGLLHPLGTYTLKQFLNTAPAALARKADIPRAVAVELQETFSDLQIALDDVGLESITIKDLLE